MYVWDHKPLEIIPDPALKPKIRDLFRISLRIRVVRKEGGREGGEEEG